MVWSHFKIAIPGAQLVTHVDLDTLDAALGELRAAGWPALEDPDSGEDVEVGGRDTFPKAQVGSLAVPGDTR